MDALTRPEELLLGNGDGSIDNFGIVEHVKKSVPRHRTVEQKKSEKSRNFVQTPYSYDSKRVVLGNYKTTRPRLDADAKETQREDYLRSLRAATYGSDR